MKTFLGRVIAVVVGIFLFIYLCFLLLTVLGSFLGDEEKISLKKNSILHIQLDDSILESPFEVDFFSFNLKQTKNIYLYNVLKEIKNAADDENIKGVFLDLEFPSQTSINKISEIRKALADFKTSGKFVYAYTNRTDQNDFFLASLADSIFHHPMGSIEWKGLGSEVTFYKNLGEKYGIEFEIIRHGKYKSAVEPFIRTDLSEENKFQMKTLLTNFWGALVSKVSESRKVSPEELHQAANQLAGLNAEEAKSTKLIDVLAQKEEVYSFLKQKLGTDEDLKENHFINWVDYASTKKEKYSSQKIAILYAGGNILPGEGSTGIQSRTYLDAIQAIEKNDAVKAVVLRINSGGGDAVTSDEILFQLKKLHTKIPIIVSIGDVAASGGYYIAQSSDRIFAEDFSITGSIGVFGIIPNFRDLANSIGITTDTVSTNANTIYYSPLRGLTPFAKEKLRQSVEKTYDRFTEIVAKGRKLPIAQVDSLGGGRVYTASEALQENLVDELGGIDKAISFAAQKAEIKDFEIVHYPKRADNLESLIKELNLSTQIAEQIIGTQNTALLQQYIQLHSLQKMKGIQMWWPYQIHF